MSKQKQKHAGTTSPTREVVRIGFLPLTDAAVVIAAAVRGFDEAHGLKLELSRENSWASLRDKLVVGLVDAAHLLAPLAMATHLGIGHLHKRLVAPLRLSLDGNVIVASNRLRSELAAARFSSVPGDLPRALAAVAAARRATGAASLTLATVFPASSHHALVRRILAQAGLSEGVDVRLVVLAPALMVDALAAGIIDGFCVGAPWGGAAVDRRVGHILATSAQFGAGRTEKLLALTAEFADGHSETTLRLVAALAAAARWCADPAHHAELAALLAAPHHIGLPRQSILRSLSGQLVLSPDEPASNMPGFIAIGGDAVSRPDPEHAEQVLSEIGEPLSAADAGSAAKLFGSDLYRDATSR